MCLFYLVLSCFRLFNKNMLNNIIKANKAIKSNKKYMKRNLTLYPLPKDDPIVE